MAESAAASGVASAQGIRDRVLKLPWWSSIKSSFFELFSKYTMHGYKNLVENKRLAVEKFVWACMHFIAVYTSLWIVWSTWTEFTDNPTITTLDNQNYPIKRIAFPAVGLCNINRISKYRARKYAEYLSQKFVDSQAREGIQSEVTEEMINDFYGKIRFLGRLLDFDIEGYEEFLSFQEQLEILDPDPTIEMWNVEKTFADISPTCDDLLLICKFNDIEKNCSEYFTTRRTAFGYCCTFNFVRPRGSTFELSGTPKYPAGIGDHAGLNVVVNTSTSDYYYPMANFAGALTLLYDTMEYPDITTGNTRTEIIDPSTENFIRISINVYEADREVKNYARDCKFKDEDFDEFKGRYTYTECLIKCKMRSIIDLCSCIPFFFPTNHADIVTNTTIRCTLQHVPCLNKYRIKWRTITPSVQGINGLQQEYQDSLNCPQCFALCSYTQYKLETTFNPIIKNPDGGILSKFKDISDLSIVRVFYASDTGFLYKISVTNTWYDLLSTFGGLFGLFLGFSIMTVLEMIYFLCFRMYQYLTKKFSDDEDDLKISIMKQMYPNKKFPHSYKEIERTLASGYNKKMNFVEYTE
uniref:CSON000508 protein n=1 Tax=Culicoides sonorensis TaxID=179676 RepID=A0A336KYA9_CULSO